MLRFYQIPSSYLSSNLEEIETEASGLWERRESNQYLTIVIGFGVVFRGSPKLFHV